MISPSTHFRERIVFIGQGVEYVFRDLAIRSRNAGFDVLECDFLQADWRLCLQNLQPESFTLVSSHHAYLGRDSYASQHGFPVDMPTLAEFISEFRPARIIYVPHDLGFPIKSEELGSLKYVDWLLMPSEAFWWLGSFTNVVDCGWIKWTPQTTATAPEFDIALIPSEIPALLRKSDAEIDEIFGHVLARRPAMRLPPFPGVERIERLAKQYGALILGGEVTVADLILRARAVVSSGQSSVLLEAACAGRPTLCLRDSTLPPALQEEFVRQIPSVRLDDSRAGLAWLDAIRCGEVAFVAPAVRIKPFDFDLFWKCVRHA